MRIKVTILWGKKSENYKEKSRTNREKIFNNLHEYGGHLCLTKSEFNKERKGKEQGKFWKKN